MLLTFCCSCPEVTVPPEILCSDCCSAELDTSDTLCANRLVSCYSLFYDALLHHFSLFFCLKYLVSSKSNNKK